MADLASLTLEIKSEQAAQAAQQLGELQRQSQAAERSAQGLERQFDNTERAATGLERTYQRVRNELTALTRLQQETDRQAAQAATSTLNLGNAVATAAQQFERFGVVDLQPIRDEIEAAEERLHQLQTAAESVEGGLGELDQTALTELEGELEVVRNAFDRLEQQAINSSELIQRQASEIIRAYNLAGEQISRSFEVGVDLNYEEKVQQLEREVARRRDVVVAIEAQLGELGRLGEAEQAEISRANELTDRFEEQSRARLRDAEAARQQAEATKPKISAQFEAGVALDIDEKLAKVAAEAAQRRALIGTIESQLAASGKLDDAAKEEVARSYELTDRFQQQATVRIYDEFATQRQQKATERLIEHYRNLYGHIRTLVIAYTSFVSVGRATEAILEFGQSESRLQGIVKETTRGVEEQTTAFERLSEEARNIGLTTQFSASAAQSAFQQMITAGFDVESSILGVRAAMKLAEAQSISLSQSIDIVSRSLQQFEADGTLATRIVDDLTNVAIRVQGDITQLAFNFNQVGPAARAAGFELEEVAATLGVLTQLRGRGQQGPLVFKELVESLVRPSKEAKAELERLGIPLDSLNPKFRSLVDILETLRAKNLSTAESSKIFGDNVAFSIPFLISQTDKVRALIAAQQEGVGVADRLARANSDNLRGSYEELNAAMQTFIGSNQGAARALQGLVEGASNVVRVLGGADDDLLNVGSGAEAVASAIRALGHPLSLLIIGITTATGAWHAYSVAVLGAKFETIGIFGLMARHPFLSVSAAVGLLATAFLLLRDNTKSARAEMEQLGDSFDYDVVDRFTDSIDRLRAAFLKAQLAGDLSKQADAVRALREEVLANAIELKTLGERGVKFVPLLNEEKGLDLRDEFKQLAEELDIVVPVELDFESAVEREGVNVRAQVATNLTNLIKDVQGQVKLSSIEVAGQELDRLVVGGNTKSPEQFLEQVIPTGRFRLEDIDPKKSETFLLRMNELGQKAREALEDGLSESEGKVLEGLAQLAADELLAGENLITVSAREVEQTADNFANLLNEKHAELQAREAERTKLVEQAVTGTNNLTEAQEEARKELEQTLRAKREELAGLLATANTTGLVAERYGELADFERKLGDAGLETTEAQAKFREETEKLVTLLRGGFDDPEKLAAFKEEFEKLLRLVEKLKREQSAFETSLNQQHTAPTGLSDPRATEDPDKKFSERRERLLGAVRAQEEENDALRDQLKALDLVTDKEEEELAIAAARRRVKPYEEDKSSLEDLEIRLEAATAAGLELQRTLEQRAQQKENFRGAVEGAGQELDSLEREIELLGVRTEAERRSITIALFQKKERFATGELEKKTLEELIQLYTELSAAIDDAATKRTVRSAVKDLEEDVKILQSSREDAQIRQRLRGLDEEDIEANADQLRGLIKQAETIRQFRFVGEEIARSFTDAFDQIIFAGAKLEDVLRGIADRILKAFLEAFAFKPFENFLSDLFAGLGGGFGGAGGDEVTGFLDLPKAKALGGVFGTAYGFKHGMAFGDGPGLAERMPPLVRKFALGQSFSYEHPEPDTTPTIGSEQLSEASDPYSHPPRGISVRPYQRGNPFLNRIVDEPTVAPLALFGEAGPEGIFPLRSKGGQLGVSAFGADGAEEVAPLRRGSGGRLGIDLDQLTKKLRSVPGFVQDLLEERGQPARPFAFGAAFGTNRLFERAYFPAPQPLALGGLMGLVPQNEFKAVPQPFAVVQSGSTTNVEDNSDQSKNATMIFHQTFNLPPGTSKDSARRTARQVEQDIRTRRLE